MSDHPKPLSLKVQSRQVEEYHSIALSSEVVAEMILGPIEAAAVVHCVELF